MIVIDTYIKRKGVYNILSQADKENDTSNIKGASWSGLLEGAGKRWYGMYPVRKYLSCIESTLKNAESYIMQTKKIFKSRRRNTNQSCRVIDDILESIQWNDHDLDINKKWLIWLVKS